MPPRRDQINPKGYLLAVTPSHDPDMQPLDYPNDALIRDYLDTRKRRWGTGTTRIRRGQLLALARAVAPTPLIAVTEDQLVAWHQKLTYLPETVVSYTAAVRGLYSWMATHSRPRLRMDDPSAILDYPRVPARPPRPMLDRHFDLALACAVSQPDMYCWLGLAGCCGLRCCEIAWMRATDVEERPDGTGYLHILGKGQKRRTVPAGEALMATLLPFVRAGGRGPVFTRVSDGRAHTPDRVSFQINAFLRSIGVRETAHQLRHRFGTDYHAIDVDIYRQAKLMGHESVNTTRRYTEVSPLEAARYIDQLTSRRLSHRRVA